MNFNVFLAIRVITNVKVKFCWDPFPSLEFYIRVMLLYVSPLISTLFHVNYVSFCKKVLASATNLSC